MDFIRTPLLVETRVFLRQTVVVSGGCPAVQTVMEWAYPSFRREGVELRNHGWCRVGLREKHFVLRTNEFYLRVIRRGLTRIEAELPFGLIVRYRTHRFVFFRIHEISGGLRVVRIARKTPDVATLEIFQCRIGMESEIRMLIHGRCQ